MDYEFDDRECLKCGHSPTHSRSCLECHGQGGFDSYDEDPINFSPGEEFETCEVCHGSGIEWWCPECGKDLAEMQDAAVLDLDQLRICCNSDCGWTGPANMCVYPHHWPEDRLCPKCNEVTEAAGTSLEPIDDPSHEGNSARYHTGKPCVESGCTEPAGTGWSPHWCQRHNAERIRRISAGIEHGLAELERLRQLGIVRRKED